MHELNEEIEEMSGDEFDRAILAFRFIQTCNDSMGYRAWPGGDGVEIKTQELHPKQEAAFCMACNHLGVFFSGKTEGKGEAAIDSVPFQTEDDTGESNGAV